MSHFLLLSISYVLLAVFVVWIAFGKRFSGIHKVFLSLLLPAIYFFTLARYMHRSEQIQEVKWSKE